MEEKGGDEAVAAFQPVGRILHFTVEEPAGSVGGDGESDGACGHGFAENLGKPSESRRPSRLHGDPEEGFQVGTVDRGTVGGREGRGDPLQLGSEHPERAVGEGEETQYPV